MICILSENSDHMCEDKIIAGLCLAKNQ